MSSVGRNDPCPCGSGEKYKACCLHKAASPESRQAATLTMPASLPGTRIDVVLHNRWKDPQDPRNSASPQGEAGLYTVTFTLGRSAGTMAAGEILNKVGDSFLLVAEANSALRTDVPHAGANYGTGEELIHLDCYVNGNGRLAKLVATNVRAENFADAEHKALQATQRLASQFAVRFNVPMHVASADVAEAATGNCRTSTIMPYDFVRITTGLTGQNSVEFSFYASLYREALNSNSPAYRFLCFYKIIEGLRARRARLGTELKADRGTPESKVELIPSELDACKNWLNDLFSMRSDWGDDNLNAIVPPEVRGYKFNRVFDRQILPLRHKIAHAVLDSGEPTVMPDEVAHGVYILRWLPITQCIARQMLKNDFRKEFAPT